MCVGLALESPRSWHNKRRIPHRLSILTAKHSTGLTSLCTSTTLRKITWLRWKTISRWATAHWFYYMSYVHTSTDLQKRLGTQARCVCDWFRRLSFAGYLQAHYSVQWCMHIIQLHSCKPRTTIQSIHFSYCFSGLVWCAGHLFFSTSILIVHHRTATLENILSASHSGWWNWGKACCACGIDTYKEGYSLEGVRWLG